MARRSTPPPNAQYLSSLGNTFSVQPPGSYDDSHSQAASALYARSQRPSYNDHTPEPAPSRSRGPRPLSSAPPPPPSTFSSPPSQHPSNPFRNSSDDEDNRSEAVFNFTDDTSTIAPRDSVSQLERRMTGRQRPQGPRAIPTSHLAIGDGSLGTGGSTVGEESYSWVPPEMLEDDRSTIVAPSPAGRQSPAAQYAGRRQESYHLARQEEEHEEEEEVQAYRSASSSTRDRSRSSAAIPLVGGAAAMAGHEERGSVDGVKPYRAGYAAVGGDDEEDAYGAYSRRNVDIEASGRGEGRSAEKGSLASAFSRPLSYVKSLGAGSMGKRYEDTSIGSKSTYPPDASFSHAGDQGKPSRSHFGIEDSAAKVDPSKIVPALLLQRMFWDTTPTERRIWEHQRGIGIQARPWACWILSILMTIVLIVELVKMAQLTGSPIQTKPSWNFMIGPSGSVLINQGARFAGCIKFIEGVSDIDWVCLSHSNSATVTASQATCTMSDICGFGGFPPEAPNQSFRFFVPIFVHAGIVHLVLNVLAQCVSSAQIERQMGTPKFLVLYFAAGIFGFVLGSNFALVGQPSIFGTHAAVLVDLIAHWAIESHPKRKLAYLMLEIIVGLGLGLVPGIDNFAHIGGFAIGILGSILFFPIITQTRTRRMVFVGLRCLAAPAILILFVVLTRNFYATDPTKACSWCRYLSCWPTAHNHYCKGTGLETITSSSSFASILSILLSTFAIPLL